jgi:hypothetical protein
MKKIDKQLLNLSSDIYISDKKCILTYDNVINFEESISILKVNNITFEIDIKTNNSNRIFYIEIEIKNMGNDLKKELTKQRNKEYRKKYYEERKEKYKEYHRNYYLKNKNKSNESKID